MFHLLVPILANYADTTSKTPYLYRLSCAARLEHNPGIGQSPMIPELLSTPRLCWCGLE